MTNNIYKGICLAALTVALAACQNDTVESNQAVDSKSGSMITIGCSIGTNTVASRAQIVLGGDTDIEYGQWNEGDSFTLYNVGDGYSEISDVADFTIYGYSDDNPSSSASFTGENIVAEGDSVIAFYPAQEDLDSDIIGVTINQITNMDANTEDDIKEYMAKNMYMYAINQIDDTDDISLTFEHLTSMARITYTNRTDTVQNISTVIIEGDDEYFGTSMEYYLCEVNLDGTKYFVIDSSSSLTQIFNDLTVAAEESVDFYFLFFPSSDFDDSGTITITINDESVEMNTSDISTTCFEAGYRYWFDVVKRDNELIWAKDNYAIIYRSVNATLCDVMADMFEEITLDDEGNAIVPYSLIKSTTSLTLYDCGLTTLDGLECFANLEYLKCNYNSIDTLDVSCFTLLRKLVCPNNNMISLNISNCKELSFLSCASNNLESLDLSSCQSLDSLYCSGCGITDLDISGHTSLKVLSCGSDSVLTRINVANCVSLEYLECEFACFLTEIDARNCTSLKHLRCYQNESLTSLDLSSCTLLEKLLFESNISSTNLDLSSCTSLKYLYCQCCSLTSLDLSSCTSLEHLRCNGNCLTSLDLSSCASLEYLNCVSNSLTSLDLSSCTSLEYLYCSDNNFSSLDISHNSLLTYVSCQQEDISMILYLTETQYNSISISVNEEYTTFVYVSGSETDAVDDDE